MITWLLWQRARRAERRLQAQAERQRLRAPEPIPEPPRAGQTSTFVARWWMGWALAVFVSALVLDVWWGWRVAMIVLAVRLGMLAG